MSQEGSRRYCIGDMQIERTPTPEEIMPMNIKREYENEEIQLQRIAIKQEEEDSEECYIFASAEDMEIVQLSGDLPCLRTALALDNTSTENNSNILLVNPSNKSPPYLAGSSSTQSAEDGSESPVFVELCSPKKYVMDQKEAFDHFIFQNQGSRNNEVNGNQSSDYDSEFVIYPVQDPLQNMARKEMSLQNRDTFIIKSVKKKQSIHSFQINDCDGLLEMRDSDTMIVRKTVQENETHPFRCNECGESFELKSHFVMHEVGHEKYKFYSFRTNTVKCICVQCKKPYLYSANDQALNSNSNMCVSCIVKLREKMPCYNIGKTKENGVKSFLEFSEVSNAPKVKEQKQCYSCGARSDRYFVYGASLLCSQCWHDRTQRAKRTSRSMRTSVRHGRTRRRNSVCTNTMDTPNLIGTHFLLSASDASSVNNLEDTDDDDDDDDGFQEVDEDWKEEVGSPKFGDESFSNNVILCDKTGEFIDLSC